VPTSSRNNGRVGAQRPRLVHLPAGAVGSEGDLASKYAADAGLILDDWQRWTLEHGLAYRRDGSWAAFEVAIVVPRQNGKGSILEALELYALYVLRLPVIVHSAHEFKTAREHFLRLQALINGSDELSAATADVYTANGKESIVTRDGCRLLFVARSRGSVRGFTGDLVVLDEAYQLPETAIGAMLPALSARPNPQVWYTSSAPHADSTVLHGVRRRAVEGAGGRLFFAEWGSDAGVDPCDEDARAAANPGYGIRISAEHVDAEFRAMSQGTLRDEFARERMGVPAEPDASAGVFPPGVWPACADERSSAAGPVWFAVDVAPGMTWSSIAAAGTRSDGLAHVELVDRRPGTAWVATRAAELSRRWGYPLVVDPRGPAAGVLPDLVDAGVGVLEIPDGEFARACAALQAQTLEGLLRHLGQAPLDAAVAGAQVRSTGDAWRWDRAHSSVDISPLGAVTLAFWATIRDRDMIEDVPFAWA
jgi:hypothetical protein